MVSLAETPLTGEPDAGNPPVRFGGRGGANTPSLPLSHSCFGVRVQGSFREIAFRRILSPKRKATVRAVASNVRLVRPLTLPSPWQAWPLSRLWPRVVSRRFQRLRLSRGDDRAFRFSRRAWLRRARGRRAGRGGGRGAGPGRV